MSDGRPLRIALVAGEESGNLLGADLIRALTAASGSEIELIGVGGAELQALGLKTLFDPGELALMGLSAIVRDLPRLLRRISETARAVAAAKPDCLITIDSPEFSLRVAKKVREAAPQNPVVHYVCPSVWAWRPERAPRMRAFVDHILCLLPFEPTELERLGGPPGTFVGHRLTHDAGVRQAAERQLARAASRTAEEKTLLLLPGSRRSEVRALIDDFGRTVEIMKQRGSRLRLLLPTVPHVVDLVRRSTAGWPQQPEITTSADAKFQAVAEADAALAASGTVALELALAQVPFVSCYRADALGRLLYPWITVWSASLPNLIADRPVVPEHFDRFIRPGYLARQLEELMRDTLARKAQRAGFAEVARRLATDRPAGEIGAEVVMRLVKGVRM